jgi:hypothetical protein
MALNMAFTLWAQEECFCQLLDGAASECLFDQYDTHCYSGNNLFVLTGSLAY